MIQFSDHLQWPDLARDKSERPSRHRTAYYIYVFGQCLVGFGCIAVVRPFEITEIFWSKRYETVMRREATIPFFQNRSDPEHSEDRPIQSDTSTVFFFFFYQCRIPILLHFCTSVDLIVTLLCVKHNLLQCFSTGGPKGSWIVYSQRNDINKKCNSKCFSDARLLF